MFWYNFWRFRFWKKSPGWTQWILRYTYRIIWNFLTLCQYRNVRIWDHNCLMLADLGDVFFKVQKFRTNQLLGLDFGGSQSLRVRVELTYDATSCVTCIKTLQLLHEKSHSQYNVCCFSIFTAALKFNDIANNTDNFQNQSQTTLFLWMIFFHLLCTIQDLHRLRVV